MDSAALYRLMTWLSPSYPVGAFSYSHGLEYAVEAGLLCDAGALRDWVETILRHGAGRSDGLLFSAAYRALEGGDDAQLAEVAELGAAFLPSAEIGLETCAQGRAFLAATEQAWPTPAFDRLSRVWAGPVAYPVAVAVACAGHGVPLEQALAAYLHGLGANLVSAGVRLVPLGQSAGQQVLAGLEVAVAELAETLPLLSLNDIGAATLMVDYCSMAHETQYTRLFRS